MINWAATAQPRQAPRVRLGIPDMRRMGPKGVGLLPQCGTQIVLKFANDLGACCSLTPDESLNLHPS